MDELHAFINQDTRLLLAILTLVVGVPLNLFVVWRLHRLHLRAPEGKVLRDRLVVAFWVLVTVVVFASIFWNNDQPVPPLDTDTTKLITRVVILALAIIPASLWLWLYRGAR